MTTPTPIVIRCCEPDCDAPAMRIDGRLGHLKDLSVKCDKHTPPDPPTPKPYAEHCDPCGGTGSVLQHFGSLHGECRFCRGTGRRIHHPSESSLDAPDREDELLQRARAAEDRAQQLQAELAHAQEEGRQLRKMLWLKHGHYSALYGDDGEQQCPVCLLDFKRHPVAVIEKRFADIAMQKALEAAK